MAKAKKTRGKSGGHRGARATRAASTDAIALLKADHRQVESWFKEFEQSGSTARKQELAHKLCQALKVHTQIEQEIFYPSFLQATGEEEIHHEAEVEHEGAKRLIADIEASGPQDEYFDAKLKVLSDMIAHHVNEEEKRGGMLAKASQSEMDLAALGEQLASRKAELMGEAEEEEIRAPRAGRGVMHRREGATSRTLAKSH